MGGEKIVRIIVLGLVWAILVPQESYAKGQRPEKVRLKLATTVGGVPVKSGEIKVCPGFLSHGTLSKDHIFRGWLPLKAGTKIAHIGDCGQDRMFRITAPAPLQFAGFSFPKGVPIELNRLMSYPLTPSTPLRSFLRVVTLSGPLAAPARINGVPLKSGTRVAVDCHDLPCTAPSGRLLLRRGTLARTALVQGMRLQGNTRVRVGCTGFPYNKACLRASSFTLPMGQLKGIRVEGTLGARHIWKGNLLLPGEVVRYIFQKGNGLVVYSVDLPSGNPRVFQGFPVKGGAYFHPNGVLREFHLARATRIAQIGLTAEGLVKINSAGRVVQARTAKGRPQTVRKLSLKPGSKVFLWESGQIKRAQLHTKHRVGSYWVAKGSISFHRNGALYKFALEREERLKSIKIRGGFGIALNRFGKIVCARSGSLAQSVQGIPVGTWSKVQFWRSGTLRSVIAGKSFRWGGHLIDKESELRFDRNGRLRWIYAYRSRSRPNPVRVLDAKGRLQRVNRSTRSPKYWVLPSFIKGWTQEPPEDC